METGPEDGFGDIGRRMVMITDLSFCALLFLRTGNVDLDPEAFRSGSATSLAM